MNTLWSKQMYLSGIILGLISFLIISLYRPLVIFVEYHFGTRIWPVFLIVGIVLCMFSLFFENIILNIMFGLIAFCSFWSIKELFQQKKGVERGWVPRKPNRKIRCDAYNQ
jgi:hypothetical protein